MKLLTAEQERTRLGNLPAWAIEKIGRLEGRILDVESLNRTLVARIEKEAPDSNVTVHELRRDVSEWSLPKNAHVRFYIGADGRERHNYIDLNLRTEEGRALLNVNGSDSLVIRSRAANSVWIGLDRA